MISTKSSNQVSEALATVSKIAADPKLCQEAIAMPPNLSILRNILSVGIGIGAVCLVATPIFMAPKSAIAQYGLGLPPSGGTGGATRGVLPQVTLIVPEDGAKTLAARPTFYWYIAPTSLASTTNPATTTIPNLANKKSDFKIILFLRDGTDRFARSVFVGEGVANQPGLYKFTLPQDAPELAVGKVQRWQVRWEVNSVASQVNGDKQVNVNAHIRRDEDPKVLAAIATAKDNLAKARIYAKNGYWYDAIDAYTNWLTDNPQDKIAIEERSTLLKDGFKYHRNFSNEQEDNITKLLTSLEASVNAVEMPLKKPIKSY